MASGLTERQEKWFASLRQGLERDTGKSLADWVAIARTCPESGHRARLAWFKAEHGLQQNRASLVMHEAFGGQSWSEPDALFAAVWADPAVRALFEALAARIEALPEVVRGQRKGYTAFSRKLQFAAARPTRSGGVRLGLAVAPDADPRLSAPKREGWSERLTAVTEVASAGDIDDGLAALLRQAWERS